MTSSGRQRGNDIGEVGRRLGGRVRIVRNEVGLTQNDLSARLAAIGRPMPTASIGRLESGDRRVDVDDLMALAYVLDVSPLSLLLPFTEKPDDEVRPTGVGRTMDAATAWTWAAGSEPNWYDSGNREYQERTWRDFRRRSHPWWLKLDARLDDRLKPTYGDLGQPAFVERKWEWEEEADDGEHPAAS